MGTLFSLALAFLLANRCVGQPRLELEQPLSRAHAVVPRENPPHLRLTIPIHLDDVVFSFELREGDNLDEAATNFMRETGMGSIAGTFDVLRSTASARLGREPLALVLAVVVAYEDDALDSVGVGNSVMWELVAGALWHGVGSAGSCSEGESPARPHIILVSNGFAVGDEALAALRVACLSGGDVRCGSMTVVEVSEAVGFGAAVNLAMEEAHRSLLARGDTAELRGNATESQSLFREAMVVVSSAAAALRPGVPVHCQGEGKSDDSAGPAAAEGCSIFAATASVVESHGGARLVFVPPPRPRPAVTVAVTVAAGSLSAWDQPHCFACAAPQPLLAFSAALWRDSGDGPTIGLGPLDEGFFLQGASGEWAHRARRMGILVDGGDTAAFGDMAARFLRPLGPRHRRVIGDVDPPSTALAASSQLAGLDADHLWAHLLADHCSATAQRSRASTVGNGVRCHGLTVGAPRSVLEERARAEDDAASLAAVEVLRDARTFHSTFRGSTLTERRTRSLLQAADWQTAWSGVGPSEVALKGWSDQLRVGAVMVLYDDALGLVEALLPDLLNSVHHTVVLVSAEPWHSAARDAGPTLRLLASFVGDPRFAGRLSVVPGLWPNEEAQRGFGNAFLAALPAQEGKGMSHVLVVDGDEFWHPAELHRSLCLVAHASRRAASDASALLADARARLLAADHDVADLRSAVAAAEEAAAWAGPATAPFARAHMATYWRTVRGVVSPPESLRILWLVSLDLCRWSRDREIDCALPAPAVRGLRALHAWRNRDKGARADAAAGSHGSEAASFDGLMLDPSAGVCHHLSYVRTTDQLVRQKLSSFAHALDVVAATGAGGIGAWVHRTWHGWLEDHGLSGLHPTHPSAYDHVEAQPLHVLPPAIRRAHLRHRRHATIPTRDADPLDQLLAPRASPWASPWADAALQTPLPHGLSAREEVRSMLCLIPSRAMLAKLGHWRVVASAFNLQGTVAAARAAAEEAARGETAVTAAAEGLVSPRGLARGLARGHAVWSAGGLRSALRPEDVTHSHVIQGPEPSRSHPLSQGMPHGDGSASLCEASAGAWRPRVVVLVVHEGENDAATGPVFAVVASVVAAGLKDLGCEVAVRACEDLRFCRLDSEDVMDRMTPTPRAGFVPPNRSHFTVVLGAHHLARYYLLPPGDEDNLGPSVMPLVIARGFSLFGPKDSALFNFEHAHGQQDVAASPLLARVFGAWAAAGALWDYSDGNVAALGRRGIKATHVPLGYARALDDEVRDSQRDEASAGRDIDVLFFGRLNAYRRSVLAALRGKGVNVVVANANGPAFGARLERLISRAKVVLSLRFFASPHHSVHEPHDAWHDEGEEWKMTRFLRPLAQAGAVVVSEASGTPAEQLLWGGAVVFAKGTDALAAACHRFVAFDALREAQASRARAVLLAAPHMRDTIRGPMVALATGACPDRVNEWTYSWASDGQEA